MIYPPPIHIVVVSAAGSSQPSRFQDGALASTGLPLGSTVPGWASVILNGHHQWPAWESPRRDTGLRAQSRAWQNELLI